MIIEDIRHVQLPLVKYIDTKLTQRISHIYWGLFLRKKYIKEMRNSLNFNIKTKTIPPLVPTC